MHQLIKFWKRVVLGCTALVAVAGSIAAYDVLRPYPTLLEFHIVEGRSCKNEMAFYQTELRTIARDIIQAQIERNKQWERVLQEQQRAVIAQVDRVKRECGWT